MRAGIVGCGFLGMCALVGMLWWASVNRTQRAIEEMQGEHEGGPEEVRRAPPTSSRLAEIDRLLSRKPDEALEQCRVILAQPADEGEKAAAQKKLAACLFRVFEDRRRAGKFEEAAVLAEEMTRTLPTHPETGLVRGAWIQARIEWARKAMKANDVERAEALAAELDSEAAEHSYWFQEYGRFRLEAGKKARAAGDADGAMKHLIAAADALAHPQGASEILHFLEQDWPAEEWIPTAERLLKEDRPAAALMFFAAHEATNAGQRLNLTPEQIAALRDRIDDCRLALAIEARAKGRLTSNRAGERTADGYYGFMAHSRNPERKLEAHRGLVEVHRESARKLAEAGKFHDGVKHLHDAAQHARQIWIVSSEAPGFDAVRGFSPEALALAAKENPDDLPERRLPVLRSLVNEGKIDPPGDEFSLVRSDFRDFIGRRGMQGVRDQVQKGYAGAPEQALADLRDALRADPKGLQARQIVECLQEGIAEARKKSLFDALVEYAGFYLEEVGAPAAGDAYYEPFKSTLIEAANHFKGKSPVRRAFLLTLLVDACPTDPAAEAARNEVVPLALEEAGKNKPGDPPLGIAPSGLDGQSVHVIENDTHTYLLIFYDGPERFFVRLAPRRRGSLVLQDGRYVTAVMTSQEGVLSYRSEFPAAGKIMTSSYFIEEGASKGGRSPFASSSTIGEFRLLRVPGGAGGFRIDPATGVVTPAK